MFVSGYWLLVEQHNSIAAQLCELEQVTPFLWSRDHSLVHDPATMQLHWTDTVRREHARA